MTPGIWRLALTAHIAFSVGWLGAVGGFLVLGVAGLTSRDAEVVRGAYLAMDLLGRFVIVPMSLAALATGLIQALAAYAACNGDSVLILFSLDWGEPLG